MLSALLVLEFVALPPVAVLVFVLLLVLLFVLLLVFELALLFVFVLWFELWLSISIVPRMSILVPPSS